MTLLKKIYIPIVVIINANFTRASMMDESSVIDLNDILSEKLMPASLFFMSSPVKDVVSEFRTLDNETTTTDSTNYDGTFTNAYSTMGFHSNFLAEQILNEVAPAHFESRLGLVAAALNNSTGSTHKTSRSLRTGIQESMRYDQGSTGYKDHRIIDHRTATMDDIYRHIMLPAPASNNSLISTTLFTNQFNRRQDKNDENDFEEGDVTGYAMQHPGLLNTNEGLPSQMNPLMENVQNHGSVNHIAGNKIEYPSEIYNQDVYSIDDEQSNLLLYNQYLEQIKATHYQDHPKHDHPFTRLKEKFKKIF